jgi:hypothetical protein
MRLEELFWADTCTHTTTSPPPHPYTHTHNHQNTVNFRLCHLWRAISCDLPQWHERCKKVRAGFKNFFIGVRNESAVSMTYQIWFQQ